METDYTELVCYLKALGNQVIETQHGVWTSAGHGFLMRIPSYETRPPSQQELNSLFQEHRAVGLKYSLPTGGPGMESGVYFVRKPDYDFKDLQPRMRSKTRRGLESCTIRRISFEELHCLGLPLNIDTLARQQREDPQFTDPVRWKQLCQAGESVSSAQAWGAFTGDELAAYTILFDLDGIVSVVHQMSRSHLMDSNANPALDFTLAHTFMNQPGVQAVCFGPEGISNGPGLDEYKIRMGFVKEPVNFNVQLRPLLRHVFLNRMSRTALGYLDRWAPRTDFYKRVRSVLDIAELST